MFILLCHIGDYNDFCVGIRRATAVDMLLGPDRPRLSNYHGLPITDLCRVPTVFASKHCFKRLLGQLRWTTTRCACCQRNDWADGSIWECSSVGPIFRLSQLQLRYQRTMNSAWLRSVTTGTELVQSFLWVRLKKLCFCHRSNEVHAVRRSRISYMATDYAQAAGLDTVSLGQSANAAREVARSTRVDHGDPIDHHAAVSGGLQLVPRDGALIKLAADYQHMIEDGLFLDDAEPFDVLMERCQAIQQRANAARSLK